MARILFLGAPVSDPPPGASTQQKFDLTGKNTGNLLIGHALRRELMADAFDVGTHHNPREANERFDLIAIPAANFIYEHFDFGYLADFIDRTSLPCLMVGIGAQSNDMSSYALNIPDGTKRLLKIVSERSNSIGVRGEYTASVLGHLGIKNVTLTGCPSLYMNLTPDLRIRKHGETGDALNVAVNGSSNVIRHSFAPSSAANIERQLLETAVKKNYPYVLQNEFPEIEIALGNSSESQSAELSGTLQRVGSQLSSGEYSAFLEQHGRVFFAIKEWSEFIRQVDFSIGTRFHGNMIALLSGVPAFIIPHDTRTLEMTKLMKIPHKTVNELKDIAISDLYRDANYDEFSENYRKMYYNYMEFLEVNNVKHLLARTSSEPPSKVLTSA